MSSQQNAVNAEKSEVRDQDSGDDRARQQRERLFSRRELLSWSVPAAVAGLFATSGRLGAQLHSDAAGPFHQDHDDAHGDIFHFDASHSDHNDGHIDRHGDGTNHNDGMIHYDVHSDYGYKHTDGGYNFHSDQPHSDSGPHTDHNDAAKLYHSDHSDVHGDISHVDVAHGDLNEEIHDDVTTNSNNHTDGSWHADIHADFHEDHGDTAEVWHYDWNHGDVPHEDHTDGS